MYFRRDIEKTVLDQLRARQRRIVLVSGARQTGKTTLIENLPTDREKLILDLWDETAEIKALRGARTLEQLEQYLATFFRFTPDGSRILVIDEAQASETLGKFLMQMHRRWREQPVVLLGSILSNLVGDRAPMPAGRVVEIVCRPLTFAEFLRFGDKEHYLGLLPPLPAEGLDPELHALLLGEYERFLSVGGLPGMVNAATAGEDLRLLFESLLGAFYRDADRFIAARADIARSRSSQYGALLEHCMSSIGRHVAYPTQRSSILSTDSPSYRTVLPAVLEAMRAWHLIYVLEYETRQRTSKQGYASKKYLFDVGVMNYLLNDLLPVSLRPPSDLEAQLLENAVLQQIVPRCGTARRVTSFKSNNKARTELDFVARIDDRVFPIEVKAASRVKQKSINQLLEYLRLHGEKRGYVVYTGPPEIRRIDGFEIAFVPPYYLPVLVSDH